MNPGTKLGSYRILAPLGSGGMGDVFRARDMRLDREVALKMVSAALAGDPERVARFQRPYTPTTGTFPFCDVSPDGQRLLMLKPAETAAAATQIVVVENWFEELKRLVPPAKQSIP